MSRSFPDALLDQVRATPLRSALSALGYHLAVDRDFVPSKDPRSERWLVSTDGVTSELVVTGAKWFDVREGKGGGGSLDLLMHLEELTFVAAVKRIASALELRA